MIDSRMIIRRVTNPEGTVSVPLQVNIDSGSALSAMLDADDYSVTERTIQTGLTTISKWWVRPGSSRMKVMRELQAAHGLGRPVEPGQVREHHGRDTHADEHEC